VSSAADPAIGAVSPTLDVDIVPTYSRALWVGGAGNVSVVTSVGENVTFVGVQAGTLLPIRVRRINSSGTTATSLLALY
jgi:hypothetical protein